jgi:hypothetical protein
VGRTTRQAAPRSAGNDRQTHGKDIQAQLRERMHDRILGTVEWLQQVVKGYFQYHAVPGNFERMRAFRSEVLKI